MDLFEQIAGAPRNLLPYDGSVYYYGHVLTQSDADHYYKALLNNVAWSHDRAIIFGKEIIEHKSGEHYNSCLLNLYHYGSEGMAWHSDAERDLKKNGAIGSLSLGAERKFAFKHKKTKDTVLKVLAHGSLLVMKDATQTHWLHRLPPTKTICARRINLTFRMIIES